jgi:hypothetical protein
MTIWMRACPLRPGERLAQLIDQRPLIRAGFHGPNVGDRRRGVKVYSVTE